MIAWVLLGAAAHGADPQRVWVQARTPMEMQTLQSLKMGFTEVQSDDWLLMHADPPEMEKLQASGLSYFTDAHHEPRKSDHHSASEMVDRLQSLASEYDDSVELIQLGESTEGRPILAAKLTRAIDPVRSMRILGAHHGDETSSAEVTLQAGIDLLTQPGLTHILDAHEVWIVPHVNPDGIDLNRRYNANQVDLNRNYGVEWSPTEFRSGDAAFSEPETRAVRSLSDHVSFGLGLSVHSGATNIGWVWNHTTERSPDETLLDRLASSYADSCTTPGFYTTNGADWYVTNGDTTDWSYGRHGTLEFTLEVSADKSPDESSMLEVIDQHDDAVPAILDWPWWIAGSVVDAASGHGLKAHVMFNDNRFTTSDFSGRFSRPVSSGDWTLTVQAPGYQSVSTSMNATDAPIEIALEPETLSNVRPLSKYLDPTGDITLDQPAEELSLHRIGHPSVPAVGSETTWSVDPSSLAPGAWNLLIDGNTARNALFVPDTTGVTVTEISLLPTSIELDVTGLAVGARVWGIWGDRRIPVELNVEQTSDTELRVQRLTDIGTDESLDLLLWTNGTQIGITDLEPPPVDTGTPPSSDTGEPASNGDDTPNDWEPPQNIVSGKGKLRASGCSALDRYQGGIWLVSFLILIRSKRRQ